MMKKFSLLLLLFLTISCSPKYYKNPKNTKKITQRSTQARAKHTKKSPSSTENKHRKHRNNNEDEYLVATSAVEVTPTVIRQYIETYKDISMVEMQRYKIPASITLAQAILESGSGQGRLARYGNNHFGIKCHLGWEGKTISHDDDEKGECFRKYKHPNESFEDHSIFIANRSRYAFLFELDPADYKGWAHGLKQAGYATDPKYPQKLISLIHKYHLHQYDEQVLGIKKGKNTNSTVSASKAKYYTVKPGDTLYKISREQNITVERIIQLNNLTNNNIQAGQQLRLE